VAESESHDRYRKNADGAISIVYFCQERSLAPSLKHRQSGR
jgi:hypothetical protein